MIHAYNETYLRGAMTAMGDMMEYACLDCNYNGDEFFKMFLESDVSKDFEIGNPTIVAGHSGPELVYEILYQIENKTKYPEPVWRENPTEYYWAGWIMAYYQWYTGKQFSKIWKDISINTILKMYPTLHEADTTKVVDIFDSLIKPVTKNSILFLRKRRGLTQKDLAREAKMSVPQLQRLEYGERQVSNLSLATAINLANALGVSVEELK